MTCAFCEGDVPAHHVDRYRIEEPASTRNEWQLVAIDNEFYFNLIPIDMFLLVRRWRYDRHGALHLLRCKECYKRHQKMLEALSEDPSDSSAEIDAHMYSGASASSSGGRK